MRCIDFSIATRFNIYIIIVFIHMIINLLRYNPKMFTYSTSRTKDSDSSKHSSSNKLVGLQEHSVEETLLLSTLLDTVT